MDVKEAGTALDTVVERILPPQVGRRSLAMIIGFIENDGTPNGSITPDFKGQWCLDTTNNIWYRAKDNAANTDWVLLGDFGLTEAEIEVLDAVTAGVVAASKAVVVDANKDIRTFRNLRSTRVIESQGAPTSDATAGARTYTAAEILGGCIVRDCAGGSRTDVLPTAALLVAAIPNATVGDIIKCKIINGSDAAETITLDAGAGGGYDVNQTAASRVIPQNASKVLHIRLTNVTAASEAYVAYL